MCFLYSMIKSFILLETKKEQKEQKVKEYRSLKQVNYWEVDVIEYKKTTNVIIINRNLDYIEHFIMNKAHYIITLLNSFAYFTNDICYYLFIF